MPAVTEIDSLLTMCIAYFGTEHACVLLYLNKVFPLLTAAPPDH